MRPVHVAKFPLFTALNNVDLTRMKHVACLKLASSACLFLLIIVFTRLYLYSPTCLSSYSINSEEYHNLFWWFIQPLMIMLYFYITAIYFILNVTINSALHSDLMETSECLILGNLFAFLDVFGSIGKSNSPPIMYLIICPLGYFALIIFIVGCTLFRWAENFTKLPVHPESVTVEFSRSIYFLIFVVGDRERLLRIYVFSIPL